MTVNQKKKIIVLTNTSPNDQSSIAFLLTAVWQEHDRAHDRRHHPARMVRAPSEVTPASQPAETARAG
jgi:hypothetical protein